MNKKKREELEKEVETKVEETAQNAGKFFEKTIGRVVGFVVVMFVNIILLIVTNFFYDKFSFLTAEFPEWLPYANASILANMIGQVLMFVIPSKKLKPLFELFTNVFSLMSVIALRIIYPFDWSRLFDFDWVDTVAKIGLIGVIVAICLAIVANTVKFIVGLLKPLEIVEDAE